MREAKLSLVIEMGAGYTKCSGEACPLQGPNTYNLNGFDIIWFPRKEMQKWV
jgi:hypothetical protein